MNMKNVALGSSLSLLLVTGFVSCDEFPQERIQHQAQLSSEDANFYNGLLEKQSAAEKNLGFTKQECDKAQDCDTSDAYLKAQKDVALYTAEIAEFNKRMQEKNQQ
jgi:hypothetical protein